MNEAIQTMWKKLRTGRSIFLGGLIVSLLLVLLLISLNSATQSNHKCIIFSPTIPAPNQLKPTQLNIIQNFSGNQTIAAPLNIIKMGLPGTYSVSPDKGINSDLSTIILGFILGFIAFFLQDYFRRKLDEKSLKQKVIKNLISEIEENKQITLRSTWVSLQKGAWDQAKSTGVLLDLDDELRLKLTHLYSGIIEKNELLIFHKIGIKENSTLNITDANGQNPTPLNNIIVDLTIKLKEEFDSTLVLLTKELHN
jgi:hypothetical protein